jgi:hypothetical protein
MTWRELTVNSPEADLTNVAVIQCKINVADLEFCTTNEVKDKQLRPLMEKGGHLYIYEENQLQIIIGFIFRERRKTWLITHLMADPFTVIGFQKIIDIVSLKLIEFMKDKKVTSLLGRQLLLANYEDLIFEAAGISYDQWIDIVTKRLVTHKLKLTLIEKKDFFLVETIPDITPGGNPHG